jgi:hypothetical protein
MFGCSAQVARLLQGLDIDRDRSRTRHPPRARAMARRHDGECRLMGESVSEKLRGHVAE